MLRLLIDTSAWLDLATRRDGQKWIVPLRLFMHWGKLELLVPTLVIEVNYTSSSVNRMAIYAALGSRRSGGSTRA